MGASGNPAKKVKKAVAKKTQAPQAPKKSAKAPVPLKTKNPKNTKINTKTKSRQRISNFRAK